MTISKEILIEQSRDVIDVIMQIGGGLMPKTMLVKISKLPQYADKGLLSQLRPLVKKQSYVMSDNKTIKSYPPLLTSTRLENYVIYTISLANARLINPGRSYTQPSLNLNALVRRLQLIQHRIGILYDNPKLTIDIVSKVDSGFLTKQDIPCFLQGLTQYVKDVRLLTAEIRYTQNAISRMAKGRGESIPPKIERSNIFIVFKYPTILALHQMGVFIRLTGPNSYMISIYEGRRLRDTSDIIKLLSNVIGYFSTLLPNHNCLTVLIKPVTQDDSYHLKKQLKAQSSEISKIINGKFNICIRSTNVFDDYFGGIML